MQRTGRCLLWANSGHRRHSNTRSARKITKGGTERPSFFAAPTFSTVSNLVARSTGRSVGLAPRRILSTKTAAPTHVKKIGSVSNQTTHFTTLDRPCDGQCLSVRKLDNLPQVAEKYRVFLKHNRFNAIFRHRQERRLEFVHAARVKLLQLYLQRVGSSLNSRNRGLEERVVGFHKNGCPRKIWHRILQKLKPLGHEFWQEVSVPSDVRARSR